MKKPTTATRNEALKIARYMGCRGAHEVDGGWMPCADHSTLLRLSNAAEKSLEATIFKPKKRRKKGSKRQDGWEELGQRGVLSIDGLSGGGIVSGKAKTGPCWPGYEMQGMKPGKKGRMVPNCVPIEAKSERVVRSGDPDVFPSADSARVRARQLGCIGIRRYSTMSGGPAWMPCTNESDYRRTMGSSPQGRRDIAKRQISEMRRTMRRLGKEKSAFSFKAGAASTPAPKKDRIYGSSRNPEGSAASRSSASSIDLSAQVVSSLKGSIKRHNSRMEELGKPEWSKASLGQLKAVWRRGAGAFSVSHRPGMTRSQWAFARVRAFLWMLEKGKPKKLSYISDRDLLSDSHPFKRKAVAQKSLMNSNFQDLLETKARIIRARNLGPRIGRATSRIPRPKTRRDGDGDGNEWNPLTGRDDKPVTAAVESTVRATRRRGVAPKISDEDLIQMVQKGRSQTSIAREFGVDQGSLSKRISRLRKEGKLPAPSSFPVTPKRTVRRNVPFTLEEQNNIRDLFNARWSISEIADALGASIAQTQSGLQALRSRGLIGDEPAKRTEPKPKKGFFDFVAERYNAGDTITQIAEAADTGYSQVASAIWNGRQSGKIAPVTKKGQKRQKRRLLLASATPSGKQIITAAQRKKLREDYRELRKTKSPSQSLREIAKKYNTTDMNVRRIVGADLEEDFVPKANRGYQQTTSDATRREMQAEYEKLRQEISRTAALKFLSKYYGISPSSVGNIVGYPDIDNPEGISSAELGAASKRKAALKRVTERRNKILEMISKGRSRQEIARELGVSIFTIKKDIDELKKEGKLDTAQLAVERYYGAKKRLDKAIELYKQGMSIENIAKATGYTESSLASLLSRARKEGKLTDPKRKTKVRPVKLNSTDELVFENLTDASSLAALARTLNLPDGIVRHSIQKLLRGGFIEPDDVPTNRARRGDVLNPTLRAVLDASIAGKTPSEIAEELNVSVTKIYSYRQQIQKKGFKLPPTKIEADSNSPSRISPKFINREKLIDLIADGKTIPDIAEELNAPMQNVWNVVNSLIRRGVIKREDLTLARRGRKAGSKPKRTVLKTPDKTRNIVGRLDEEARTRRALAARLEDIANREKSLASHFSFRQNVGKSYETSLDLKGIGMSRIGRRARNIVRGRIDKPEYDGDNDGFVTNPMTGRDDLPFASVPQASGPRRKPGRWTPPPTKSRPTEPTFEQMSGETPRGRRPASGGGDNKPPRLPKPATPPEEPRFPKKITVDAAEEVYERDDSAMKIGDTWIAGGATSKIKPVPPGLDLSLRQWNGLSQRTQEILEEMVSDPEIRDEMSKKTRADWEQAIRGLTQPQRRLMEYSLKNRLSDQFDESDMMNYILELDDVVLSEEDEEARQLIGNAFFGSSAGRDEEFDDMVKAQLAKYRHRRERQKANPSHGLEWAPRLEDDELYEVADAATISTVRSVDRAIKTMELARDSQLPNDLFRRIALSNIQKLLPGVATADDASMILDMIAFRLGYPVQYMQWIADGDVPEEELELLMSGGLAKAIEELQNLDPESPELWPSWVRGTTIEPDVAKDVPDPSNDPDYRPYRRQGPTY